MVGRDSSVGTATPYGLDGLGFESHSRQIFLTYPHWPWGQTRLLYNEHRVILKGKAVRAWR
jgi:hypothetical protein